VSKQDIFEYIVISPQIIELYDIDPVYLQEDLNTFPTQNPNAMTFSEFLAFLKYSGSGQIQKAPETKKASPEKRKASPEKTSTKGKVRFSPEKEQPSKTRAPAEKAGNACLLSDEILNTLREIYHQVDKYDDLIVPRLELVKKVREDVRIARILHKPAVHIKEIDKYLNMERILRQIEDEEKNAIGESKRAKEYISLNQFLRYFTNYETPDSLAEKLGEEPKKKSQKLTADNDEDFIEINPDHLKFFKEIFDTLPKKQNSFVETIIFIDEIRKNEHYKFVARDVGRRKAAKYDLQSETVEEVINRMENEAEGCISWEEVIQFFTRRGRPLYFISSLVLISLGICYHYLKRGKKPLSKAV